MRFVREIFLFGLVGGIGFLVDSAVLMFARPWLGLFYGRALSFVAAVITTWLLNRRWTFKARSSSMGRGRELCVYFGLMLLGGAVNYAVYAWLVSVSPLAHTYPVLGVAAGSLAGMGVNLLSSRCLLFRFAA